MTTHEHSHVARDAEVRPHGLIVMDKPPGPSGFDCIRHLRKNCNFPKKWKAGHLGTLDPFASGVMVVALGQAVRYTSYGLSSSKKYRARLWLGDETSTLDPTGEVIKSAPVPTDWRDRLDKVAKDLTGKYFQTPPIFSAKHIDGKRSYIAARQGETVELEPVEVEIFSLEFGEHTDEWVDFTAHVSGGTYIRSLGRDIAIKLGTVGHLLGLERTQAGKFPIDEAIPFRAFEVGGSGVLMHHLRKVEEILENLKAVIVRNDFVEKIKFGKAIFENELKGEVPESGEIRLTNSAGDFLSLGRVEKDKAGVIPFKPWISD